MLRISLLLFTLLAGGCVLGREQDRRPEILPGRYRAANDSVEAVYDFHADGSFSFERKESGRTTITETGRWEYLYVGPEDRFLIEREVKRRDLGADMVWRERENLHYQYRIEASSSRLFHLNPGYDDMHGALVMIFVLFGGSGHVVFHRQ